MNANVQTIAPLKVEVEALLRHESIYLAKERRYDIFFRAMDIYLAGKATTPYPDDLLAQDKFARAVHFLGSGAYLMLGIDIEEIYQGITLKEFTTIVDLFCSTLELSAKTVFDLISKTYNATQSSPLCYMAIWTICQNLLGLRSQSLEISQSLDQPDWWLIGARIPIKLLENETFYQLTLIAILDSLDELVIAYRAAAPHSLSSSIKLAFYDAIASRREPSDTANHGIVWKLPERIISSIELPIDIENIFRRWGVEITYSVPQSSAVSLISSNWSKDLPIRKLLNSQFNRVFENYLANLLGDSPGRNQARRNYKYRHSSGYQLDPAQIVSDLRNLLPYNPAHISESGVVERNQYHYENNYLIHWAGRDVKIRCSENTDATIWVYLDDEILCQAQARELRRQDGSYRTFRKDR